VQKSYTQLLASVPVRFAAPSTPKIEPTRHLRRQTVDRSAIMHAYVFRNDQATSRCFAANDPVSVYHSGADYTASIVAVTGELVTLRPHYKI